MPRGASAGLGETQVGLKCLTGAQHPQSGCDGVGWQNDAFSPYPRHWRVMTADCWVGLCDTGSFQTPQVYSHPRSFSPIANRQPLQNVTASQNEDSHGSLSALRQLPAGLHQTT